MFTDFSVLHFLIYAAGIGFAAAIIYTNIQRTALSVFINYLADSGCFSNDTAVTLSDIGLVGIQKVIVTSAIKHQYGLKKCISVLSEADKDSENSFFEKKTEPKYFLLETNTEFLKKKYSFKTMPTKLVVLFIAALAVIVFATSAFVSWLISTVTIPKQEKSDTEIESEDQLPQDTNENESADDYIYESSDIPGNDSAIQESEGPRIPI